MKRKHHKWWRWDFRQGEEGWGLLMSFLQPPIPAMSSPFNPSFLAHSTHDWCSGLRGPVLGWLDREHRLVWGERWDVLCSLPLALREKEVEGGGCWLWRCGGGYVMPQAAQPLLLSVTPSTGTLLFLFSSCFSPHTVSLFPSFSFSYSLHAFQSLLSSACRHTLTCCMSPCGNPACHLSIYLKETRFNLLIAEPGIYWCIFIVCWLKQLGNFRHKVVTPIVKWPGAKRQY